MKKIMLTVVAGTMLLSNVAFALIITAQTKTDTTTTVSSSTQYGGFHINTTDPH